MSLISRCHKFFEIKMVVIPKYSSFRNCANLLFIRDEKCSEFMKKNWRNYRRRVHVWKNSFLLIFQKKCMTLSSLVNFFHLIANFISDRIKLWLFVIQSRLVEKMCQGAIIVPACSSWEIKITHLIRSMGRSIKREEWINWYIFWNSATTWVFFTRLGWFASFI